MRLIDADAFIKDLKSVTLSNGTLVNTNTAIALIEKYPTAYDIDKVVEKLEERSKEYNSCVRLHGKQEEMLTDDAIEIIKQSSVSDDVCEWKLFNNSLFGRPQWVYETTCGKYVGAEHTSKAFVYCPYCGKKIKVVGK